jgi:hypothetical protein
VYSSKRKVNWKKPENLSHNREVQKVDWKFPSYKFTERKKQELGKTCSPIECLRNDIYNSIGHLHRILYSILTFECIAANVAQSLL